MYETMSESRKRRGSRHLMWPSKKIIHMHSRLKFWRRQLMIFLCTQYPYIYIYIYIYICTLFMLHRCLWPYIYILILILILIYIYINTNMNINIIDYNGISIWTMCSKTKSWKTHYVTRGLGAPLFQFLSLTSPSFVALNLPSLSNPSQKRSGSKAETERTPWYIPQCLNTTGSYKIHLCAAWSDQSIHPHLKPTSYIYIHIYIYTYIWHIYIV